MTCTDGKPAKEDFLDGALHPCGVGSVVWSNVIAVNEPAFAGHKGPQTIEDFFDVAAFPGKRGLPKRPNALLEWALMADGELNGVYALDGVITTVDALLGLTTLENHETSRRQAAVADRIVLTKTDLEGAQTAAVSQRIFAMNPDAHIVTSSGSGHAGAVHVRKGNGRLHGICHVTLPARCR